MHLDNDENGCPLIQPETISSVFLWLTVMQLLADHACDKLMLSALVYSTRAAVGLHVWDLLSPRTLVLQQLNFRILQLKQLQFVND
jgi:hypothetical protein